MMFLLFCNFCSDRRGISKITGQKDSQPEGGFKGCVDAELNGIHGTQAAL